MDTLTSLCCGGKVFRKVEELKSSNMRVADIYLFVHYLLRVLEIDGDRYEPIAEKLIKTIDTLYRYALLGSDCYKNEDLGEMETIEIMNNKLPATVSYQKFENKGAIKDHHYSD